MGEKSRVCVVYIGADLWLGWGDTGSIVNINKVIWFVVTGYENPTNCIMVKKV